MTRTELETTLARRLNYNTTLDSATQARLREYLNLRHRWLLSQPGLTQLREGTQTFTTTTATATYGLVNVSQIKRIVDTTNDRPLLEMSRDAYRQIEPDPTSNTGTASHFVVMGYQPVVKHPSDASALFIDSTSASDTGTAYVEGEVTGGYPRAASVTMTGLTAVNISTAISTWIRVTKLYLSAAAAGVVTLYEDNGGGTELAKIGIGQTTNRYLSIALWPTPTSGALPYSVDYTRLVTDLAQNTDEPWIPHDFHDILIWGALADEYEKLDDSRYDNAEAKFQKRLNDLRYHLAETATGGMADGVFPSKFKGDYYPAGGWGGGW